jgi:hypothetical protein
VVPADLASRDRQRAMEELAEEMESFHQKSRGR